MTQPRCPFSAALLETSPGLYVGTLIHCKSWRCAHCAQVNAKSLRQRLQGIHPTRFLTLTCRPSSYNSPSEAFQVLGKAINRLFKRIRRRYPHISWSYFGVWELTSKGWPHAHLLIEGTYIPQKLLSKWWDELTGSPIVDIRAIRGLKQVRNYVLKYVTKSLYAPPHMHRYRSSKGYLAPKPEPTLQPIDKEHPWTYWGGDPKTFFADLRALNWQVEQMNATLAVARPP